MNNPKARQDWIYNELVKEPALSYDACFRIYSPKFGKTERTFTKDWVIARERSNEYHKRLNKAKDDISIKMEIEAHKTQIKGKLEHIKELQSFEKELLSELERLKCIRCGGFVKVELDNGQVEYIKYSAQDELRAKSEMRGIYAEVRGIKRQIGEWSGYSELEQGNDKTINIVFENTYKEK